MLARIALALLLASLAGPAALAQAWPARPIQFIVGFPPGGATDTVARIVAAGLSERLGQQVVVDNKPGAASNIGTAQAAKAAPDGYTLLLGSVANAINASLYKHLAFDFGRDFEPVILFARLPNALVVPARSPYRSIGDVVAAAKRAPGKLNFGSAGTGTSSHMSGAMLASLAGIDIVHVPYRGTSPALTDLIGGRIDMMFDNLPAMLPHVAAGELRPLAVSTATRSPKLPDIPTMEEAGIAGFEATSWSGIVVPDGTPEAIVARLNREANAVLADPDTARRLDELGYAVAGGPAADFARFIRAELDKWAKVVAATGVQLD